MIDCHVHTALSHHGAGSLRDCVEYAIDRGVTVLGFAEHAPLPFDAEHRLTEREASAYLREVAQLRRTYRNQIVILGGLEVDYVPSHASYIATMLPKLHYDFALGSIHFVETPDGRVRVWDYAHFHEATLVSQYVHAVRAAATSGLFDGIAHPDIILRAGIDNDGFRDAIRPLLPVFRSHGISYEVNCSGMTKDVYDPATGLMATGRSSYPDLEFAAEASSEGVALTVGSDAHEPDLIGCNIELATQLLKEHGVREITYGDRAHRHTCVL